MSRGSKIEWTDDTWNPLLGCTKVSAGCDGCYAIRTARRLAGNPDPKVSLPYAGLVHRDDTGQLDWTGRVNLVPDRLDQPLRWRKPRRIFVNSQSDLFHDAVPMGYIEDVFAVMAAARQHTFQLLTKRHARMRNLLNQGAFWANVYDKWRIQYGGARADNWAKPLPNVHLGVSAENQQWADIRIPALLATPAAVRWLSCEPLLGEIDLSKHLHVRPIGANLTDAALTPAGARACGLPALDWVVVGGESGPGARPMDPDWARSLRDECQAAGIAYNFKQFGEWAPIPPAEARPADTIITPAGQTMPWADRGDLVPEVARRSWVLRRVGKKIAGRELDGRIWDEYPETVTA
jgi:protein gp37